VERLLRPDEAGAILGITADAIRRLARDGRIAHVKLGEKDGGRMRFRPSDLQAFIDGRVVAARPAEPNPALARIRDRRRGQQSA
jgi:excisionase family DNA binding protein